VFAEAQATGLPVIGSAVGGVSESMIDAHTGMLCPPSNVVSIRQAILFFLENRQAINEFGARGRSFVESEFALNHMTDAFDSLYQSLLTAKQCSSYRMPAKCLGV